MEDNRKVVHFTDEVTLKIAVKDALPSTLRAMIPSSACIIRYETFKNYSFVTWSEEARKINFPDATEMQPVRIGKEHEINVYWKNDSMDIVTTFAPFRRKNFVAAVEKCPNLTVNEIMTIDGLIGFFHCSVEKNTQPSVIKDYLTTVAECYDSDGNIRKMMP